MKPTIELYDGTRRSTTFWDGVFLGFSIVMLSVGIALIIVKLWR